MNLVFGFLNHPVYFTFFKIILTKDFQLQISSLIVLVYLIDAFTIIIRTFTGNLSRIYFSEEWAFNFGCDVAFCHRLVPHSFADSDFDKRILLVLIPGYFTDTIHIAVTVQYVAFWYTWLLTE